ncbi:hypothetical protein D1831_11125 [Lactiplantibacillus garii]|uniref:Extracellular protein n=1 Tax=Lactiplantibacillus garii TaxID=2306423 RepID=A0A426D579_9LACO|nr:hypothetical protein [Lactiplantibacillus garii]RRK09750.1 hypothetical protein D1831_11125 [Lactiplantibacillus garii]
MRWQQRWLMMIGVGLGVTLMGAPTVQAAKVYRRSAVTKLKAKTYYSTSTTGKAYRFSGTRAKTRLKATVALKNYRQTTWKATKRVTLTRNHHAVKYVYVTNQQRKAHGWVWSGYLTLDSKRGKTVKGSTSKGVTSYRVKGDALTPYQSNKFSTVAVGNYALGAINYAYDSDYATTNSFQTANHTLKVAKRTSDSASNYVFKTALYLPIDYKGLGRKAVLGNPQSAAFSKNDHYLYVMYVDNAQASNAKQTGWVIRYDMTALSKLFGSSLVSQDRLRRATNHYYNGTVTAVDQQVLNCMKVGPRFTTGHAQSLALNPKTNQLWFIKSYKDSYTAVVERLSAKTLKPNAKVSFKLNSKVHMGSTLTFDKSGNAYYWTQTKSAWPTAPVNSVKFYKGVLGTGQVHFKLIMQGLAKAPGKVLQSVSYNQQNGRLYLVADESIFSVPLAKLGHLTTRDVSCTNFSGHREFEGLIWRHRSNAGYLLTNKGPELMRLSYQ